MNIDSCSCENHLQSCASQNKISVGNTDTTAEEWEVNVNISKPFSNSLQTVSIIFKKIRAGGSIKLVLMWASYFDGKDPNPNMRTLTPNQLYP